MASFDPILAKTFKFEGGFQASPNDSANYCGGNLVGTNRGISAVAYSAYYNICPSPEQMKSLTANQAKAIYKKNFWDVIKGDSIKDQSVAHIMFDAHIASGYEGLRRIKKAINKYYGKEVTTATRSAITNSEVDLINKANSSKFFEIVKAGEIANRKNLAATNPSKYGIFLDGWLTRLDNITYEGKQFVKRNWVAIGVSTTLLAGVIYFIVQHRKAIEKLA